MDELYRAGGLDDHLEELHCLIAERGDDENDDLDDIGIDSNFAIPLLYDAVGRPVRINLAEFAIECDRFKIPSRAASYLCNALLKAFGIINEMDRTFVIDRMRIERARKSVRKQIKIADFEAMKPLSVLSFDSRIDWTKILESKDGKTVPKTVRQNHCVLVQMDGLESHYLGHVTVEGKKKRKATHTDNATTEPDQTESTERSDPGLNVSKDVTDPVNE